MRLFKLIRKEDETGISGTGEIAEGIEFSDGRCVLNWTTKFKSIGIYDNLDMLINIHGHDGKTIVKFII